MQLGKFDTDRDSALHYLCISQWGADEFGHVESPVGYVWRISNEWDDVKPENTELTSSLDEWFEQQGDVEDNAEFRASLVGHFLVVENDQGFVNVVEFSTEADMLAMFEAAREVFETWDSQEEV